MFFLGNGVSGNRVKSFLLLNDVLGSAHRSSFTYAYPQILAVFEVVFPWKLSHRIDQSPSFMKLM